KERSIGAGPRAPDSHNSTPLCRRRNLIEINDRAISENWRHRVNCRSSAVNFMWCRIDIGAHHASFCLAVHRGVISGRPPKDHSGCRADLTSEDITQAYLGAVAIGSPDALSLPNDSTSVGFLDFVYPSCWPCGVVACSLVSQKIFWLGGSRSRQIAPAVNQIGRAHVRTPVTDHSP